MKDTGSKLTRRQELAIAALLTEPTLGAAAAKAGIGDATLWRWLQLPSFQEAYRSARRQVVSQAVARLQAACSKAVETLEDVMGDKEAKVTARVAAAKATLELAIKAVEIEDLVVRVETLERMIKGGNNGVAK